MKPQLLGSLKGYNKKTFLSDLTAAVMVAVVALPLSIALGLQSGAALQAGLISAIVGGFLIAAFSGAKYSIGGPSATFVLLTAGYLANEKIGLNGTLLIVILAGVILIVGGLLKAGKVLKYIPYPVVLGFTAGIGILLLAGQFKDFLGLKISGGAGASFIGQIKLCFKYAHTFNIAAFCLGVFALLVIYLLPKLSKKLPSVIISLVASTLLALALEGIFKDKIHIPTIGSVYGNIKAYLKPINFLKLPPDLLVLIVPAFTIALLSFTEGLMSATVAEELTGDGFDANTELIGHGIANIGSGLCGGLPVCGAIARTSVNISGGARTPIAGMLHAVIVLLFYVLLMPLVKFVPLTALAAVLIKTAINMSRFNLVARFIAFGLRDCLAILATVLFTLFFGVLYGILVGVAAAVLMNIPNFKRGLKIEECALLDIADSKKFRCENVKAFKVKGTVFFANVSKLTALVKGIGTGADEIVLDFSGVDRVDATAVEKLSKLTKVTAKNGGRLVLHNMSSKIKIRYRKAFEHIVYSWR